MKSFFAVTVLAAIIFAGCDSAGDDGEGGDAVPHALVGIWVGTWTDTQYYVTGSMSITVAQSGSSLAGTGSIDLSSIGRGASNTGTASGTISGDSVSFTFSAGTVGSGNGPYPGPPSPEVGPRRRSSSVPSPSQPRSTPPRRRIFCSGPSISQTRPEASARRS